MIHKIIRSFFFLIFLLVGLAICAAGIADHMKVAAERKWTPANCTILYSSLVIAPSGYRLNVQYRYVWQGHLYVSTVYQDDDAHRNNASDVDRLVALYAPGSAQCCLVNPANPADALLAARPLWNVPLLLAGLAFLLPGAMGTWFTWRPIDRDRYQMGQPATAGLLGSIFTLVGLGMFWGIALPAIRHYWTAKNWPAVPCVVQSSRVNVYRGSKHDTYAPDVLYQYQFGGRTYRSSQYSISSSTSSSGAYTIVNRFPVGTHATCFVDPGDPYISELNRDLDGAYLFLALFSVVFALVGLAALIFALNG
jgi:hypothetical protein